MHSQTYLKISNEISQLSETAILWMYIASASSIKRMLEAAR
jgi:hypothetical protein